MDDINYYGNQPLNRRQIISRNPKFKNIFFLTLFTTITICTILNTFLMIKTYQYNTSLMDQIRTLNYEDASVNNLLREQLMPRIILMEKIITFQLPSAIMKAFEVSHQDLRISLSSIMYDLKRVIELYKALMGFEDDWILSNNAQKLQCSWSDVAPDSETQSDESLSSQERINSTINSLDNLFKDNYSLIHELQLVFGGIFKTVTDYRRRFSSLPGNETVSLVTTQIQSDYLLYLLSLLNHSDSISTFAHQLKHSRIYLLTQYKKESVRTLDEILKQVETSDWVFPILREFQVRRYRRNPQVFLEPTINPVQWSERYRRNIKYFYNVDSNYTTVPLLNSLHHINKRYVRPGIFRLPTYYYDSKRKSKMREETNKSVNSYKIANDSGKPFIDTLHQNTMDDINCKSYVLPGYKLYYCKDHDFTCQLKLNDDL